MHNVFPKIEVLPHWAEVSIDSVQRAGRFVLSICRNTNVPMHMSNHYNREHFVDDGQPKLPFGE